MENILTQTGKVYCPSGRAGHIGRFLWKKDGWPVYRCETCAHVWISPPPTEKELKDFYDEGYFEGDASKRGYGAYDRDKETVKGDFWRYLSEIEARVHNRHLLDIGAATGFFCRLAQERGWQAHGVELSAYAANVGRERGLDIREGTFEMYANDFQGVGAITAWDVVEHLQDPFGFFQLAARTLAPEGVLMCALPQGDSFFARAMGRYWTLLAPPQHLHFFSLESVRAALQSSGFTVVSIDWPGKAFSLSYLVHFMLGWFKRDWPRVEAWIQKPLFHKLKIRINPRDMMIILAQKKTSI